ncbi:MAG: dihydroneopterin aldolase [Deltaproteobacteria bacterium]|nr:dihydroneopterin aldolase [Deltaproteobacteria bacterium]
MCETLRMAHDAIEIAGLRVDAVVGIYPHERRIHQRLVFHLTVETDLSEAGRSDDIRATVDYDRVAQLVRESAGEPAWLVEAMAERIATRILELPRVDAVTVRVEKPGALVDAATVAIVLRRSRSSAVRP